MTNQKGITRRPLVLRLTWIRQQDTVAERETADRRKIGKCCDIEMKLDPKLLLPTILAAFLVMVVFLFWFRGQKPDTLPSEQAGSTAAVPPGVTPESLQDSPSKDNVNHTFLAEENRLRMAVDEAPGDTTSLIRLARFYHDAHKLDAAIDIYTKYLDQRPDNTQAWADLADCYANNANLDGARDAMERALEHFPDNAMILYNLGAIHANMGKFDEAKGYWTRVRDMDSEGTVRSLAIAGLEKIR